MSKLLWFRNNRPEVYARTCKFLLLEDYILYKLTGRFVTEKSLLTSTGYFDVVKDCIWDGVLDLIGVGADKIPEACECGEAVGYVSAQASEETGLSVRTLVAAGAMDQAAGAVARGISFRACHRNDRHRARHRGDD